MEKTSHPQLVDVSVCAHRALFKIRSVLGINMAEAIRTVMEEHVRHFPEVKMEMREARRYLSILRRAWPKLTVVECVEVATTVTQAASAALLMTIRSELQLLPQPEEEQERPIRPPMYGNEASRRRVVRDTLRWIEWSQIVNGNNPHIDMVVDRVTDDRIPAREANILVESLLRWAAPSPEVPGATQIDLRRALKTKAKAPTGNCACCGLRLVTGRQLVEGRDCSCYRRSAPPHPALPPLLLDQPPLDELKSGSRHVGIAKGPRARQQDGRSAPSKRDVRAPNGQALEAEAEE